MNDSIELRVVHLSRSDPAQLTAFADLAEAVYRLYRENPRVSVTLDDVDRGSDTLVVVVRTGIAPRVEREIKAMISDSECARRVEVQRVH